MQQAIIMRKIKVCDSTLRDGAQAPGVNMSPSGRFYVAKALADTGVDVIECGFAANRIDYDFMRDVAKFIGSRKHSANRTVPVVCSIARLERKEEELAYKSLEPADPDKRRIHVFIGTSKYLMDNSHGRDEDSILEMVPRSVEISRGLVGREGSVQFSPEDAMRTDPAFLLKVIQRAVDAGADMINVTDTTGVVVSDRYFDAIKGIRSDVRGDYRISAHVHNDSGTAVATTLKGIEAGADQIVGCVNQLGERAGSADWIVVVNDLRVLSNHYGVGVDHIDATKFYDLAKLVTAVTNQEPLLNHPVTGKVAFTASSGIHVNALMRDRKTYNEIPPESVGRELEIVLGQTSGRRGVAYFLETHGYDHTGDLKGLTEAIKRHSTRFGDIADTEARLLAQHYVRGKQLKRRIHLIDYKPGGSMRGGVEMKDVVLGVDGAERRGSGAGEGPVDAFMTATKGILGIQAELYDFSDKAVYRGRGAPGYEFLERMKFSKEELELLVTNGVSRGQSAIAQSNIQLVYDGQIYHGRGSATDILPAPCEAIVSGFDAIYRLNSLQG